MKKRQIARAIGSELRVVQVIRHDAVRYGPWECDYASYELNDLATNNKRERNMRWKRKSCG